MMDEEAQKQRKEKIADALHEIDTLISDFEVSIKESKNREELYQSFNNSRVYRLGAYYTPDVNFKSELDAECNLLEHLLNDMTQIKMDTKKSKLNKSLYSMIKFFETMGLTQLVTTLSSYFEILEHADIDADKLLNVQSYEEILKFNLPIPDSGCRALFNFLQIWKHEQDQSLLKITSSIRKASIFEPLDEKDKEMYENDIKGSYLGIIDFIGSFQLEKIDQHRRLTKKFTINGTPFSYHVNSSTWRRNSSLTLSSEGSSEQHLEDDGAPPNEAVVKLQQAVEDLLHSDERVPQHLLGACGTVLPGHVLPSSFRYSELGGNWKEKKKKLENHFSRMEMRDSGPLHHSRKSLQSFTDPPRSPTTPTTTTTLTLTPTTPSTPNNKNFFPPPFRSATTPNREILNPIEETRLAVEALKEIKNRVKGSLLGKSEPKDSPPPPPPPPLQQQSNPNMNPQSIVLPPPEDTLSQELRQHGILPPRDNLGVFLFDPHPPSSNQYLPTLASEFAHNPLPKSGGILRIPLATPQVIEKSIAAKMMKIRNKKKKAEIHNKHANNNSNNVDFTPSRHRPHHPTSSPSPSPSQSSTSANLLSAESTLNEIIKKAGDLDSPSRQKNNSLRRSIERRKSRSDSGDYTTARRNTFDAEEILSDLIDENPYNFPPPVVLPRGPRSSRFKKSFDPDSTLNEVKEEDRRGARRMSRMNSFDSDDSLQSIEKNMKTRRASVSQGGIRRTNSESSTENLVSSSPRKEVKPKEVSSTSEATIPLKIDPPRPPSPTLPQLRERIITVNLHPQRTIKRREGGVPPHSPSHLPKSPSLLYLTGTKVTSQNGISN